MYSCNLCLHASPCRSMVSVFLEGLYFYLGRQCPFNMHTINVCIFLFYYCKTLYCPFSMCSGWVLCQMMDVIVHLGENSQCPSTQEPIDVNCNFGRSMWKTKPLLLLRWQPQQGVPMLGADRILHNCHRVHCNHRLQLLIRFEGLTGRRSRCLSSSPRNVLSGTGGIIAINFILQSLCIWNHDMEIGPGWMQGCGGFPC